MYNGISISVSDDHSDEIAGNMKVRIRKKRRKLGFHKNNGFCSIIFRKIMRWWTLLIFVPAIGLLILEGSRLTTKTPDEINGSIDSRVQVAENKPVGNLNRVDPITRVVNGSRQPCLKLLPPEALENLDIPIAANTKSPVKRVVYRSEVGKSYAGDNAALFQSNTMRFNLFTGYQTLQERKQSFKVNETPTVHCGFYSDDGGFRISEEDKDFMKTCAAVVSTCTFGGGDDLYQPIGMSEASLRKVCYVAFWDEVTLSMQEAAGTTIGKDHMIGKWRIVIVRDLPFADQRLNGKIPKMLSHRLFPQARYSIWVDSKSQFRRDPLGVLEALLWRTNSVLAISEHGARSSVYDEGKAVVKKHKATPEEVDVQLTQYRLDGFPDDKRFNGKKALAEASIIVRENMPMTNLFMCLWFNEAVRFTSRDQMSFPYVLRQLNLKNINMFPVCTRRDLVNSMGHKRKAKPLAYRDLSIVNT
ncbi:hypothetical protein Syun_004961 [Stephania yunnanensis]|uniref:TOD1/MUCI70 glycosyltransferase-like domain-containing protein n=1 Tax=Stephania yunnanensis TaxID=152371 RepID=A0AAP0L7C7_9MAGN